eukprot:jgi/Botrbrau1/9462/Bobra.0252s0083.1
MLQVGTRPNKIDIQKPYRDPVTHSQWPLVLKHASFSSYSTNNRNPGIKSAKPATGDCKCQIKHHGHTKTIGGPGYVRKTYIKAIHSDCSTQKRITCQPYLR